MKGNKDQQKASGKDRLQEFDAQFHEKLRFLDKQLRTVLSRHAETTSRLRAFVSERKPAVELQQRIVRFLQTEALRLAKENELENIRLGRLINRPEDKPGMPDFNELRTNLGTEELLREIEFHLDIPKMINGDTATALKKIETSEFSKDNDMLRMSVIMEVEERIQKLSHFLDKTKKVLDTVEHEK